MKRDKAKIFELKMLPMDMARLVRLPLLLIFRIRRVQPGGQPYRQKLSGPALIAMNHTSFADPFIVGACFWYRRVYCMASEEVMGSGLRFALLKAAGCIKINRSIADIQAIREAVRVLKEERRTVAIFPQGHISAGGAVESVKSGTVLIALQAGVPIIPMYVPKAKHFFSRRTAYIGEPIVPETNGGIPSLQDIDRISGKLQEEMNRCACAYAGMEN